MYRRRAAFPVALILSLAALSAPGSAPEEAGRQVNRTALWQRSGRDLLKGFRNMYNFRVLREPGAAYPYRAWFFGWATEDCNRNVAGNTGCDAIFAARARALDGPWEVYAGDGRWDATQQPARWRPVITAQRELYDEWHNGDPSVVKVGRTCYMAYSATGHNRDRIPAGMPGDRDGSILCIMGAASEDGVTWRRSPAPLLLHAADVGAAHVPDGEVHLYGSYHRPSLLHEGGRFRLWFDYWTPQGLAMGYAENRGDFLRPEDWKVVRADNHPCLPEFPNPNVVRVGGLLHAFADAGGYGSHPWKRRKIVEAVSEDGLRWEVLGYVDPDADTPAIHVPEAFVQPEGREAWLVVFYACQIGGEPYDYRYDRIRAMRRRVTDAETRRLRALLRRQERGSSGAKRGEADSFPGRGNFLAPADPTMARFLQHSPPSAGLAVPPCRE